MGSAYPLTGRYGDLQQRFPTVLVVQKPANTDILLAAMSDLVDDKRIDADRIHTMERI